MLDGQSSTIFSQHDLDEGGQADRENDSYQGDEDDGESLQSHLAWMWELTSVCFIVVAVGLQEFGEIAVDFQLRGRKK